MPLLLADQGVSSLSNFLVIAAVAGVSSPKTFGAFTLGYLVYGLALGLGRAACGDILLIKAAGAPLSGAEDPRDALAFSSALGLPFVAVIFLIAAFSSGATSVLAALAAIVPVVLLQDGYRYVLISQGAPQRALAVDGLWLSLQVLGYALAAIGVVPDTPAALMVVWGIGATVSVAAAARLARLSPRGGRPARWISANRGRVISLGGDFSLLIGISYLAFASVPLVAGLSALGALRGAQLLFAPIDVLLAGLRLIVLPALSRAQTAGRSLFRRRIVLFGAILGTGCGIWGLGATALPDAGGEAVLGETWSGAAPLMAPFAIAYVARGVGYPLVEGLRATGGTWLIRTRLVAMMLISSGLLTGAAIDGARGGAIGFAAGLWLSQPVWGYALHRALRERRMIEPDVATLDPSPARSSAPPAEGS